MIMMMMMMMTSGLFNFTASNNALLRLYLPFIQYIEHFCLIIYCMSFVVKFTICWYLEKLAEIIQEKYGW